MQTLIIRAGDTRRIKENRMLHIINIRNLATLTIHLNDTAPHLAFSRELVRQSVTQALVIAEASSEKAINTSAILGLLDVHTDAVQSANVLFAAAQSAIAQVGPDPVSDGWMAATAAAIRYLETGEIKHINDWYMHVDSAVRTAMGYYKEEESVDGELQDLYTDLWRVGLEHTLNTRA